MSERSVSYRIDDATQCKDPRSDFLSTANTLRRTFSAHEHVIRRGTEAPVAHVIISGVVCRCTLTADGRRQFTALLLPGDVIGIEWLLQLRCADSAVAMAETVCQPVSMADIRNQTSVISLWQALERQTAASGEWMLNLAARPAVQRMAYFFHETSTRMRTLGISNGPEYPLPLIQSELADFLALTPVHVNRCLTILRRAGLASLHNRRLEVADLAALEKFADADSPA